MPLGVPAAFARDHATPQGTPEISNAQTGSCATDDAQEATAEFLVVKQQLDTSGRLPLMLALEPKVFQVLLYLLEHRDRAVPKDELFAQCWPETFVSESALNPSKVRFDAIVRRSSRWAVALP